MDWRRSHCPHPPSSETTAKGTGLRESAAEEDLAVLGIIIIALFLFLKISNLFPSSLSLKVPGQAKYEFDTQLSARLYKLKINRSTSASSNSELLETLDESDESHYDPPSADISNQESSKATEIEIEDDDGEFDALESIKNGTFRGHSKNKPVHANIVNTGFATLERPDGSIQVVSKQTLCWFLEEKTWKRSSDRKFRFQSSPAGFYQIKKNPKKVEKITLETGH